jgi:hypothetical protein
MFPVPASNELNIENNGSGQVPFTFNDLSGRKVKDGILAKNRNVINISDLPKGLYLVKIISGKKLIVKKFLKK